VRYLSVCSGIEAASVAWHPLGWTPVGFSEIEPFPSAVLAHRFPNVLNYGDMTKHKEWPLEPGSIDLLVGGTPCQSFSVAGLRKGLSDPRGGLMLTYLEIAQRLRPRWVVWENVPGVLSSGGGRDFGSFLGALGELGYGWAYRVLDAQWVRTHGHPRAVPQRRRRVFVVGCLGDWTAAAKVLFERESVQRDSAKGRAAREEAPADAGGCAASGQYWNGEQVAAALTRKGCDDRMPDKERLFAVLQSAGYRWQNNRDGLVSDGTVSALRASAGESGFHEMNHPVVTQPVPFRKAKRAQSATDDETSVPAQQANTLNGFDTGERDTHAVAFQQNQVGEVRTGAVAGTVNTNSNPSGRNTPMVIIGTDCYNGAVTGDVAATMGTPGSSVNASGPTVMQAMAFPWQSALDPVGTPSPVSGTLIKNQTMAVAHALRGEGFDASEDGTGRGTPLVAAPAVAFTTGNLTRGAGPSPSAEVFPTLRASDGRGADDQRPSVMTPMTAPTITATNDPSRSPQSAEITQQVAAVHASTMTVRRLTPRECERLQGFPDDWTLIPWRGKPADQCPDGPRYKALGNSMAVNCMEWIGQRIAAVDSSHAKR
jgi:DNA-cytosine methyltransferase